ncbi:hypothetical protein QYF36_005407 [Acer negundo]|nr:hypothetical protein QYF36_005407 [Acer negundo]
MSTLPLVTGVVVDNFFFSPAAKPPASTKTLFLGGAASIATFASVTIKTLNEAMHASVRGLDIEGKFKKFTAIRVYLENTAVPFLASKWKGKSVKKLTVSVDFFQNMVAGPFERFTQVSFISPLTGVQYTDKVVEYCIAIWKSVGKYTEA